jgi:Uncharacterized proteins, homologs of microcin C7 resistance protein MccF
MDIIKPKKLKAGDTVGIVSPSGFVAPELKPQFDSGVKFLENLGLRVKVGKNVFKRYYYSAGTVEERVADIHEMFADPEVKAVIQSQGGETANELLDSLDWNLIKRTPKIFGGMSDGTALLLPIFSKTGIITLHGPDLLWGYGDGTNDYETESLKQSLFVGKAFEVLPDSKHEVSQESSNSSKAWKCWREGISEGRLLGGNLSIIQTLQGTGFEPPFKDTILFLEGYCHNVENLARRFTALRQTGVFKKIKGVVLGYFFGNTLPDPLSNRPVGEVMLEASAGYDFPILEIGEIGHNIPNCNLPVGALSRLDTGKLDFSIMEDFFV